MKDFPYYGQPGSKDCGPTCLKIIAKYYKKTIPLQKFREISETQRQGSNLLNLSHAAETIGFRSLGVKVSLKDLHEAPLPCILHWNKNHYVVLYKISQKNEKWQFWKKNAKRGAGSWEREALREESSDFELPTSNQQPSSNPKTSKYSFHVSDPVSSPKNSTV